MSVKIICLHGPESTGKSTLGAALAQHFDAELVTEYGRDWCAEHGADTSMADLVAIAETHGALIEDAVARADAAGRKWLILDTDPVMTAVWAQMLYGQQDPVLAARGRTADLYLVPDIDLPWVADGLRYLGAPEERSRFMTLSVAELEARSLAYAVVRGDGASRLEAALAAIAAHLDAAPTADAFR